MTEATDLALRFITAVADSDFEAMRACYAPNVRIWHSTDRAWQNADENIKAARGTLGAVKGFRYGDARITATETGALVQASLRGRLGGKEMDTPVCLVITVAEGLVVQAEEYIDQGHLPR